MLKTVVLLNIFAETGFFDEKKVQMNNIYLKFCHTTHVLTVTFDQFNACLLNKTINFFTKSSVYYHISQWLYVC